MTLPKPCKRQFAVPIYGEVVHVVIAKDIHKARAAMNKLFGPYDASKDEALCDTNEAGINALFFRPDTFTTGVIAHEVFHLTMHILSRHCALPTVDNQEPAALLNEYLTLQVYKAVTP